MQGIYKRILLATFGSMGLLAGCANPATPSDSNTGSSLNTSLDWSEQVRTMGIKGELAAWEELDWKETLLLKNEVGNIEVFAGTDDKMTVHATIWALNNDSGKAILQNLLEQAEISVNVKGSQMEIAARSKVDNKVDLWTWAEKKYGNSKFSIDYKVKLPAAVTNYEISTGVGEIHLSKLSGTYSINNNVGAITIEEGQVRGKSSVKSEAGSIRLGINQMDKGSSLKATTDVGSLTAKLPGSLAYSLKTETDLGRITGAAKGKSDINGGGPLLTLISSVGSITVENE